MNPRRNGSLRVGAAAIAIGLSFAGISRLMAQAKAPFKMPSDVVIESTDVPSVKSVSWQVVHKEEGSGWGGKARIVRSGVSYPRIALSSKAASDSLNRILERHAIETISLEERESALPRLVAEPAEHQVLPCSFDYSAEVTLLKRRLIGVDWGMEVTCGVHPDGDQGGLLFFVDGENVRQASFSDVFRRAEPPASELRALLESTWLAETPNADIADPVVSSAILDMLDLPIFMETQVRFVHPERLAYKEFFLSYDKLAPVLTPDVLERLTQ